MPPTLSGVTFNIALNAFRPATFCLFTPKLVILVSMGSFLDVLHCNIKRDTREAAGIPTDEFSADEMEIE